MPGMEAVVGGCECCFERKRITGASRFGALRAECRLEPHSAHGRLYRLRAGLCDRKARQGRSGHLHPDGLVFERAAGQRCTGFNGLTGDLGFRGRCVFLTGEIILLFSSAQRVTLANFQPLPLYSGCRLRCRRGSRLYLLPAGSACSEVCVCFGGWCSKSLRKKYSNLFLGYSTVRAQSSSISVCCS